MASKLQFIPKYTGSLELAGGQSYPAASFSMGNIIQMKTRNINVILNSNGIAFSVPFNDMIYVDSSASYTFSEDCTVAFLAMIEVVAQT